MYCRFSQQPVYKTSVIQSCLWRTLLTAMFMFGYVLLRDLQFYFVRESPKHTHECCLNVIHFYQDGYDVINKSLEKGILLTKDVVRFFKKRMEIEEVYCKSLQKAVQKFEPLVTSGYVI